jgi:hypothetical protein
VDADRDLATAGVIANERARIIEQYGALSLAERRFRYEGKAVPGYERSPETANFLACDRRMRTAKGAYLGCVNEALVNLIPLSTDTSDVVAHAAIGMCSAKRSAVVTALTCFSHSQSQAEDIVSQLDRQLWSVALGKVAATRAEMNRRKMQEQAPKVTPLRPSAPASKTDI